MVDLRVSSGADAVERAALAVAAALQEAVRETGHARLAVPGGSAAAAVGIVRARFEEIWSTVHLTWVDERCVPQDDEDSNRGSAYRAGILDPGMPPALEIPLWLDGEQPDAACDRFRQAWQRDLASALDVVLLGMGEDGHVASLFPGRPWPQGVVGLVNDSPKPPPKRMTLTRAALATARCTVLLATGAAKRDALLRLVGGGEDCPARGLPGLMLVTDQDLGEIG